MFVYYLYIFFCDFFRSFAPLLTLQMKNNSYEHAPHHCLLGSVLQKRARAEEEELLIGLPSQCPQQCPP